MPCIPGTGTCIALGTVLTLGGIAATGADVGMEASNAYMGRESVFDIVTGGPTPVVDSEKAFLDKCIKTGGKFSKRCPPPPAEQPPAEPPPNELTPFDKYANIISMVLVIMGMYFVKKFL